MTEINEKLCKNCKYYKSWAVPDPFHDISGHICRCEKNKNNEKPNIINKNNNCKWYKEGKNNFNKHLQKKEKIEQKQFDIKTKFLEKGFPIE